MFVDIEHPHEHYKPYHHHPHHKDVEPPPLPPIRGLLSLAILCLIKQKPTYGSQVYQDLKEKFGLAAPRPLIYTLLRRLEKGGLVTSTWEIPESGPARRVYRITEEGLDILKDAAVKLREIIPLIEKIIKAIEEN